MPHPTAQPKREAAGVVACTAGGAFEDWIPLVELTPEGEEALFTSRIHGARVGTGDFNDGAVYRGEVAAGPITCNAIAVENCAATVTRRVVASSVIGELLHQAVGMVVAAAGHRLSFDPMSRALKADATVNTGTITAWSDAVKLTAGLSGQGAYVTIGSAVFGCHHVKRD